MRHLILPFFLTATGFAQAPVLSSAEAGKPLTIDVFVDGKSGPVTGLTQQDFVLRENKAVVPITSIRPVQPVAEVIAVVDAVNIDQRILDQARQRIGAFLAADGGKLAYPTTLAILQDKGVQIQTSPTRDGNGLKAALDKTEIGLREIRRSNGIYGADDRLGLSLKALRGLLSREASKPGRKVILFVSPGWPILSGPEIDLDSRQQKEIFADVTSLYDLFRASHTILYSIDPIGAGESLLRKDDYEAYTSGVENPGKTSLADLSLQVLALHSGGLVLNSNNDTTALLREAVRDASAGYELTYTPTATEGEDAKHSTPYHHIEVRLQNSNTRPRTIDGYYSNP